MMKSTSYCQVERESPCTSTKDQKTTGSTWTDEGQMLENMLG